MKKSPFLFLSFISLPTAILYFSPAWPWLIGNFNTAFPIANSFMKDNSVTLAGYAATVAILSTILRFFWKKRSTSKIENNTSKPVSENQLPQDNSHKPTIKTIDVSIVRDTSASPFLGLSAFQQKDEPFFFGRQREIEEALAGFSQKCRWLQIEGNSGSGKSSFVNAGLLSLIEKGVLSDNTGFKQWHILEPMMPSTNPIEMLASVLADNQKGLKEANRNMLSWVKELEQGDERAFSFALREYLQSKPETAILLIVDQFEELFTFAKEQPRKKFDALLANALKDPECSFFMISTVRADFLDRLELLDNLHQLINPHCARYFLPQISEQGLREVVLEPAKLAGLDVTSVSEMIISDAAGEIGALPLVENALDYLWQHREGDKLSATLYAQKGGLAGLLSDQANTLLSSLGRDEKYALKLLLRLTRVNREGHHTRRRISWEDAVHIAGGGSRGESIILHLSGQRDVDKPKSVGLRLITIRDATQSENSPNNDALLDESNKSAETSSKQQTVDLIHETLIRKSHINAQGKAMGYWPKLYDYIEANRDNDIRWQQLQYQSENWANRGLLGRWWNLASLRERQQYKKLDINKNSQESRFLFWSTWMARLQALALIVLFSVIGESIWWAGEHKLPPHYVFKRWHWQLGYIPEPEMVTIPAGSFMMGCVSGKQCNDNELPVHPVTIAKPFEMGKFEVTFEQYDWYVWQQQKLGKKVDYPLDRGWGRAQRPVINVSWNDARAYIQYLNKATAKHYRLPSEAEWEYAARASTKTAYSWGDELGKNKANCDGCGSPWGNLKTAPIGSFSANNFGLYDVHGNVWEWVQEVYTDSYSGAKKQQEVVNATDASRVVRGGSWIDSGRDVRSTYRYHNSPDNRNFIIGFRLSLGH